MRPRKPSTPSAASRRRRCESRGRRMRAGSLRSMKSRAALALPLLTLCATLCGPFAALGLSDQPSSFDHAATDQKLVALTFDADMTPGMLSELKSKRVGSWYNEKVIETLRREQVP